MREMGAGRALSNGATKAMNAPCRILGIRASKGYARADIESRKQRPRAYTLVLVLQARSPSSRGANRQRGCKCVFSPTHKTSSPLASCRVNSLTKEPAKRAKLSSESHRCCRYGVSLWECKMRRMVSGEMPRTSPSSCSLQASSAESKVASGSEQHSQVFHRPTCPRAMRLPVAIHLAQTRQRLRGAPIQCRSLDPCRDDPYHTCSLGSNPDLRPFHTAS